MKFIQWRFFLKYCPDVNVPYITKWHLLKRIIFTMRFLSSALFLTILTVSLPLRADQSSPREHLLADNNWKFILGDSANAQASDFDDSSWRSVDLPHDWSIGGKFNPKAPMGGPGGFLPAGIGWYRLHFDAPSEWADKRVRVEFEGVYENADIYLNGQKLMSHPYGFTSFFVDLSSALKVGASNLLAARVDNSEQKNCRWYSGSGIYRHVWLYITNPVQVAPWGVFVSVPKADAKLAKVVVQTDVLNQTTSAKSARIETMLLAPDGHEIGRTESPAKLPASGHLEIKQELVLKNPPLWFPETPQLSSVVTRVIVDGQTRDQVTTKFGVRALAWSADKGLTLNGKTYKLSGGCIHADNGVLGACAFDRAEERKIELLKAAGYNAVRTAHNPPSPALLDACDRLGMLVLDEAFDCWTIGKNTYDYHLVFKDWWRRDIDSMVERDRNHPSVVMWSIGNEVPQIFSDLGPKYTPKLVSEIHMLDGTRPVTNGINSWPTEAQKSNAEVDWNSLDIVGSNYRLNSHIQRHAAYPGRILVSTESTPPIGQASHVLDNSFVVGDFVWTAQDYLGEVGTGRWYYAGDPGESKPPDPKKPGVISPFDLGSDKLYPWHGALCGSVDLIGNSKPAAHLRNIVWNMGEKLYLAVRQPEDDKKIIVYGWGWYPTWENWTWPGREGKPMEVEVYSRYPRVRLYLNGQMIGESNTTDKQGFRATFKLPYQPGTLKAVGLQGGNEVGDCELSTASDAAAIRLIADRATIHANGQDLSFVQVEVVDKDGRLQPNADQEIAFTLSGPSAIAGLGSANMKSEEPYQGTQCRVFHGQALVVIRSTNQAGSIDLKAHADGLTDGSISIQTQ